MAASVSFAVDVSNNQEEHQPWASFGVHLGFAKASEGQRTHDAWFARHIADIKAAGLVPGAYHFAWPNQDVAVESANYIRAARDHTTPLFVHALDLERYPNGARNYAGRTSAQIRQYAHDWIAAVKTAFSGQKVGIYTSGDDILDGHLPGNEDFLWYPAYPVQGRTFQQAATATRPAPSGRSVWGWQFASVPRDQTVIYMSPAALRTWAAGTPTVQEDDMPLTDAEKDDIAERAAKKLLAAKIPSRFRKDAKGAPAEIPVSLLLESEDGHYDATMRAVAGIAAQVGALTATVAAIQKGDTLTAAQLQAIATAGGTAGAKAALAELGDALTD